MAKMPPLQDDLQKSLLDNTSFLLSDHNAELSKEIIKEF